MKKIYLYLTIAFISLAVVITPKLIDSFVEDELSKEIGSAKSKGLEFKILNKQGYFSTKRDVQISIVDSTEFFLYLIDNVAKINLAQAQTLKQLIYLTQNNINQTFNGTIINGVITNSNLIPSDLTAQLYLSKFSPYIMNSAQSDNELSKIITPILDNKVLLVDMVIDSNKNIKKLKVKDIDQKYKYIDTVFVIKYIGNLLEQQVSGQKEKGIYQLDKYELGLRNPLLSAGMALSDLNYQFNFRNDYEGRFDIQAKNLEYFIRYEDDKRLNNEFSLKKLDAFSNIKVKSGSFDINLNYKIKGLVKLDPRYDISVKNSKLDVKINQINKKGMLDLIENIQNESRDSISLVESLKSVINNGFKSKVAFELKDFRIIDTTLEDIKLDLKLYIDKNNKNIDDKLTIVNELLKVEGKIKLLEADVTKLVEQNETLEQFINSAKKDGNYFIFDLKFDKNFYINQKLIN